MLKTVSFWRLRPGVSEEEAEKQYYEEHVPLAQKLPGLRRYTIGKARGKDRPYYRMAELCFDNREALNTAMSSPEGVAVREDPGFHALIEGMTIFYFEEEEVNLPG